MLIRFTQAKNEGRGPTMTIVRKDGSTTGQATTGFFVAHDLTHFAVESLLGIDRAFFGLLDSGWEIDSFSERAPSSPKMRPMPPDALAVEVLVGCLDAQRSDQAYTDEMILERVAEAWAAAGLDHSAVTSEMLQAIRDRRDELLTSFRSLPPGGSMELRFPDLSG